MDTFTAMLIAEGSQDPANDQELTDAWQTLVDTGLAWQLQGFFGRTAEHMMNAGLIQRPQSAGPQGAEQ